MIPEITKEQQYKHHVNLKNKQGLAMLGLRANAAWHSDPRLLLFSLSRYKFVAKMFSGKKNVLEVGCGDAFATRIVQQEVGSVYAIDFDPVFLQDAKDRMDNRWKFDCQVHDILTGPVKGSFDAAYSLDVIEHISKEDEDLFLVNIIKSLNNPGVLIIGTPSLQSQIYASELSKQGHVNCKDHIQLKTLMQKYFYESFIFSMNDEVVHTGFCPMAHYLFALCVGMRPR